MMLHGLRAGVLGRPVWGWGFRRYLGSQQTEHLIEKYSKYKQTPISIKQFADFGKLNDHNFEQKSLSFLRTELPIRLSHMTKEIDKLPVELLRSPHVQRVRGWYTTSFTELVNFPSYNRSQYSSTHEYTTEFRKTLQRILARHSPVVVVIARAIMELKKSGRDYRSVHVQYFLDRFYMSRIGIRMLVSQHIETSNQLLNATHKSSKATKFLKDSASSFETQSASSGSLANPPGLARSKMIGVVDENCNILEVARDAADQASFLCEQYYFRSPRLDIVYPANTESELVFSYIPSHLYHIFFELFKNSMRAVVETHPQTSSQLPAIKVVVVGGRHDITVKISDEGGGISRSAMTEVFTYLYTTASLPESLEEDFTPTDMNHAPMAGFGYGLPVSRLYARYMGGDLQLISMEGYGTDAFLYLKKSADIASEVLPEYSVASIKHYNSTTQLDDWFKKHTYNNAHHKDM